MVKKLCIDTDLLTVVDNSDSLALAAGDRLGRYQSDSGVDTQHFLHGALEFLLLLGDDLRCIGEVLGQHLDPDLKGIGVVDAVYQDLIVRRVALIEQYRFDLAREDIDAANDHHIVGTSHRLVHADKGSAAGAFLARKYSDVAGTITNEREGFFIKRGKYQLTLAAFGKYFAGIGINDLGIEVVLVDVHTILLTTFKCYAGTARFGQSVDIVRLDSQRFLDIMHSERFIDNTHILRTEAFTSILNTYRKAERHRLTRFTLLRIIPESESELIIDVGNRAAAHLRQDDHLGMGADGNLYILLPNTALKNAEIVMNRLKDYSIHTVAADNVNKGEEQ